MKNFVNSAWGYPRDIRIMELGSNLFQFYIPWVLDNQILVLRNWYEGVEEDDEAFNLAPLWVQIWNLPVHWISKEIGRKIGKVFDEVRDAIVPQVGGKEGRHLKILVTADISQPLLRGTTVKMNGTTKWLAFKYERCPDFCYKCGLIGHSERNCKCFISITKGKSENQFGPWLRANGGKASPQKEQQSGYNPERSYWGFRNGELVPRHVNHKESQAQGSGVDRQERTDRHPLQEERNTRMNDKEKSTAVGGPHQDIIGERKQDQCEYFEFYSYCRRR